MAGGRRDRLAPVVLLGPALLAVAVFLGGCAALPLPGRQEAAAGPTAADFTLPDQDGRGVTMKDLRGKAVVLDFIYTNCPPDEECPVLTAKLVGLQQQLKTAGLSDRVVILSITFDPERDTPEVLKAYAQQFGADLSNWHFLRGNNAQTREVSHAYSIGYNKLDTGGFEHTAVIMVIDPQGRIRAWEPPGFGGRNLLEVVQQVL